jgi:UDP-N-acetylglucosamine pyrophosphorylase
MGKHLLQLVGALSTSLKIDKFILEGDSSLVVSPLQNLTLVIDWHIENVINDTISSFAASSL